MTVPLCVVCYEFHDDSVSNLTMTALQEATPAILIDNTSYSLWGANGGYGGASNCVPSYYTTLGTEVYSYITGGYEGTSYGDTRDNLSDNEARIAGMAATDNVTGVFLDEVSNFPDAADKVYLQAIKDACTAAGLKLIFNTGLDTFDSWLMGLCDFIMTDEGYDERAPTADEAGYLTRVLVVLQSVNSPVLTAITAAANTNAAYANGFQYAYACNFYTTLPTWLSDYVALLNTPSGGTVTLTKSVAASLDDGFSDGTNMYATQTWFEAGLSGVSYDAFFRFLGCGIPADATVSAAYIRYVASGFGAGTALKIHVEHEAAPAQITTAANHTGRTRSTAFTDWDTGYGDSDWHNTPDFSVALQEVIDAHGALDTIQVLVDDNGSTAEATGNTFDNAGYVPELHVTYTYTPILSISKSVTAGADDGLSSSSILYAAETYFLAGSSGNVWDAYFRFLNCGLPANCTITVAYLEYLAFQFDPSTALKVYAEDAKTPEQITSFADHAARVRTSAGVDWDSGLGGYTWRSTPSIVTVIQELVTKHGALDTIQILVDDDGSADNHVTIGATFENVGYAPRLHVTYTLGTVVTSHCWGAIIG